MFRFQDPKYLYLLLIVVLLGMIYYFMRLQQSRCLRKFGDPQLVKALMPDVSRWRPLVKFCLLETILALLIVMLARPQLAGRITKMERSGIEMVIAVDVSNSMMAEDVRPNRLSRAKMMIENLLNKFTNDKIALIVFAGDAFVQLPITNDFVSAKMFLSDINPSMIRNQGTDLAKAIEMASESFTQASEIGKAIIIITDGEDHEGGAEEAAKAAREKGCNVFMLGIGSTSGAPVPDPETGKYIVDETGTKVLSSLNEQMCASLAKAGGGAYIHVENNSNAQRLLEEELDKLLKGEFNITSDYDEQYQAVGIIVLILLILEICIYERKNPAMKNVRLFSKRGRRKQEGVMGMVLLLMLFFGLSSGSVMAQSSSNVKQVRKYVRDGNKRFRSGNRTDATTFYQKAYNLDSTNARVLYNLATSMMPEEYWRPWPKTDDSIMTKEVAHIDTLMQVAADKEVNQIRKSMSCYNLGVMYQSLYQSKGNYQHLLQAIEAYKDALRNNPTDDDARYNLVVCQKQLKKDNQQQNGQNQNNQDEKKDNQDDQKNDSTQQQQQPQQNPQQNQQDQQQQNMDRQNAEQLLKNAMQREKETQKRMNEAQQGVGSRRPNRKNW